MKAVLALDTSSAWCSVSIKNLATTEVCTVCDEAAGNHFEQLSHIVQRALSFAGVRFENLCEVIVGIGPGSFTGLRIAMSYAKGVSWARQIPLTGRSSFAGAARIAALDAQSKKRGFCVISDARRGEVFFQCFTSRDGITSPTSAVSIVAVGTVLENSIRELELRDAEGIHFLTPDRQLPPGVEAPLISSISRVSEGLFECEQSVKTYSAQETSLLGPNYVRAVAAETIEERSLKAGISRDSK